MRNRPTGWARNKALRASVATLSVRHTIAAAHRRPDLIEKLVLIPVEPSFAEKTASAVIYRAKQCPELVEKFVEAGRDA